MISIEAIAIDKDHKAARVTIRTERGEIILFVTNWYWQASEKRPGVWAWQPTEQICEDVLQEKIMDVLSVLETQEV